MTCTSTCRCKCHQIGCGCHIGETPVSSEPVDSPQPPRAPVSAANSITKLDREFPWNRSQTKKGQPGKANHREAINGRDLILLGKGAFASLPTAQCAPWMGVSTCPVGRLDPVQAEKNRIAGYWR